MTALVMANWGLIDVIWKRTQTTSFTPLYHHSIADPLVISFYWQDFSHGITTIMSFQNCEINVFFFSISLLFYSWTVLSTMLTISLASSVLHKNVYQYPKRNYHLMGKKIKCQKRMGKHFRYFQMNDTAHTLIASGQHFIILCRTFNIFHC